VPFYACVGLLIGLGAWAIIRRQRWMRWVGLALAVAPIAVYAVLPDVARRLEFNPFTRSLPYRDPYRFFLTPWQQNTYGVRRYVDEAFEALPQNAVLFADITVAGVLLYAQQVEARRPDLRFVWAMNTFPIEGLLLATFPPRWRYPVYLVSNEKRYAPAVLLRDCRLVPEGVLYRVKPPGRYPDTPWR
jgi:hypothetical protein